MPDFEKGSHAGFRATGRRGRGATVMTAPRFTELEIAVTFDAARTTVAVRGEVDLLTAAPLHAAMIALVGQARVQLTLDLAALTFMDASGLRVIADVAERLAMSGRMLTVRSAPPMTRRILDITRLSEFVRIEQFQPDATSLGAEQLASDHSLAPARTTPGYEAIDSALRRVTALVHATVEGADGVSVTLERDGRLATVAASNDTVLRMDGHQYETGEGPCLSAADRGHWFHIESLADEKRWPAFVPRAIEEGIASVLSMPLLSVDQPLGALNIYSNTRSAFGPQQQELATLFAEQASALLIDADAAATTGQYVITALVARQTIARAQGVLMAREHLTADAAASAIHRSARSAKIRVAHHAAAIVASTRNADAPNDEGRSD
jgi:anti-anti-sigma factor